MIWFQEPVPICPHSTLVSAQQLSSPRSRDLPVDPLVLQVPWDAKAPTVDNPPGRSSLGILGKHPMDPTISSCKFMQYKMETIWNKPLKSFVIYYTICISIVGGCLDAQNKQMFVLSRCPACPVESCWEQVILHRASYVVYCWDDSYSSLCIFPLILETFLEWFCLERHLLIHSLCLRLLILLFACLWVHLGEARCWPDRTKPATFVWLASVVGFLWAEAPLRELHPTTPLWPSAP